MPPGRESTLQSALDVVDPTLFALIGDSPQSTHANPPSTVSTTGALQSMHFSAELRAGLG
ncbi:hypothetical protein [Halomicrobium urmianum]|uniref:hypothetical protein n=1 Tax=Halomicrobium urmianum TaxID=1586233 RepID=UPI001CD9407D|nr:hypothetical protein [Halomicrobium urmianum]